MTKKEFDEFVEQIPTLIDKLKKSWNKSKLTYSFEEIHEFNSFYFNNFEDPSKVGLEAPEFSQIFSAYVGTAYRYWFGGDWILFDSSVGLFLPCIHNNNATFNGLYSAKPIIHWRNTIEREREETETRINLLSKLFQRFSLVARKHNQTDEVLQPVRDIY